MRMPLTPGKICLTTTSHSHLQKVLLLVRLLHLNSSMQDNNNGCGRSQHKQKPRFCLSGSTITDRMIHSRDETLRRVYHEQVIEHEGNLTPDWAAKAMEEGTATTWEKGAKYDKYFQKRHIFTVLHRIQRQLIVFKSWKTQIVCSSKKYTFFIFNIFSFFSLSWEKCLG